MGEPALPKEKMPDECVPTIPVTPATMGKTRANLLVCKAENADFIGRLQILGINEPNAPKHPLCSKNCHWR